MVYSEFCHCHLCPICLFLFWFPTMYYILLSFDFVLYACLGFVIVLVFLVPHIKLVYLAFFIHCVYDCFIINKSSGSISTIIQFEPYEFSPYYQKELHSNEKEVDQEKKLLLGCNWFMNNFGFFFSSESLCLFIEHCYTQTKVSHLQKAGAKRLTYITSTQKLCCLSSE